MACFGQVRQDGIKVFSKLGGQYLGDIHVANTSMNALQQVRFLQLQAASLCPHPTRSCKDLLLYVDQQQVGPPGMPYITEFSPQERLDVEQALSSIKSTKTIHVMWDESDEHAQRVINETTHVCMEHEPNVFCIMLYKAVPKEITYLARRWAKQGVTTGTITNLGAPCVQDLRFLRSLNLTSLVWKDVVPTSWEDCNVQALQVEGTQLDFAFNNLDKVKELSLLDRDLFTLRRRSCLIKCRALQELHVWQLAQLPEREEACDSRLLDARNSQRTSQDANRYAQPRDAKLHRARSVVSFKRS